MQMHHIYTLYLLQHPITHSNKTLTFPNFSTSSKQLKIVKQLYGSISGAATIQRHHDVEKVSLL